MPLFSRTRALYHQLSAAWRRRRRNARTRAELRGLDGRELQDLGLGRGELEYLLKQD